MANRTRCLRSQHAGRSSKLAGISVRGGGRPGADGADLPAVCLGQNVGDRLLWRRL
jgi:hypothetical protein